MIVEPEDSVTCVIKTWDQVRHSFNGVFRNETRTSRSRDSIPLRGEGQREVCTILMDSEAVRLLV
jgi:hypothetical protein